MITAGPLTPLGPFAFFPEIVQLRLTCEVVDAPIARTAPTGSFTVSNWPGLGCGTEQVKLEGVESLTHRKLAYDGE